jgi:hypothetical protein
MRVIADELLPHADDALAEGAKAGIHPWGFIRSSRRALPNSLGAALKSRSWAARCLRPLSGFSRFRPCR